MFRSAITMRLDIKKAGFLWLSKEYYKNWKAYFNKQQLPIHQTRANFASIFLPKGKGELVLKYRPGSTFKFVLFLSLITLMLIAYMLIIYSDFVQLLHML